MRLAVSPSRRLARFAVAAAFAIALHPLASAQSPILVDQNSPAPPGSQNGDLWATAFSELQPALDLAATTGRSVLIAEGDYYPTENGPLVPNPGTDLDARSFVVKAATTVVGTEVYGGFLGNAGGAGASTDPSAPDGSFSLTRLRGDSPQGFRSWNVLTVVDANGGLGARVVFDGLVISGGAADESSLDGGGVYVNLDDDTTRLRFENVTFRDNFAKGNGGGVYLRTTVTPAQNAAASDTGVQFANCRFIDNHSESGAGLAVSSGGVRLGNCRFRDNGSLTPAGTATAQVRTLTGGALSVATETAVIAQNCILHHNSAVEGGGVHWTPPEILSDTNGQQWLNCTIAQNRSLAEVGGPQNAGGFRIKNGRIPTSAPPGGVTTLVMANTIVWGNFGWDFQATTDNAGGGPGFTYGIELDLQHVDIGTRLIAAPGGLPYPSPVSIVNDLNADPLFINAASGNFNLRYNVLTPLSSSPCIDRGLDSLRGIDYCNVDSDTGPQAYTELLPVDFTGFRDRVIDSGDPNPPSPSWGENVDLGALEVGVSGVPVQ